MPSFEDLSFSVENFSGKVRLFPLPNLVLFPHVMQPLHIFEPRYRRLLEDALADDRLVAMALLKPGWESDYEGRPALYPTGCLGRVTTYHRLEDGTYNLLLLGVERVRLLRELESNSPYREAEVELCEDQYPPQEAGLRGVLQSKLRDAFVRMLPMLPEAHEQMDQLTAADVPLGVLTDLIGYMLDIDLREKERLLAETNVYRRTEQLLRHLASGGQAVGKGKCLMTGFPPQFSAN
jgi:ATP-dependent Lon protease